MTLLKRQYSPISLFFFWSWRDGGALPSPRVLICRQEYCRRCRAFLRTTATDADYAAILGVIGHEYFHNWIGNRVTCHDWFQLSLKEGLTVFRDQELLSDMGSRAIK